MDSAYFVSRGSLLGWLNELLGTKLSKVEQCATGVPYVQLLPVLFPASAASATRAKLGAANEYEASCNFKIVQDTFTRNGVPTSASFDIDRLVKKNPQANLEFLQWFKRYCDQQGVTAESCAAAPATLPLKSPGVSAARGPGSGRGAPAAAHAASPVGKAVAAAATATTTTTTTAAAAPRTGTPVAGPARAGLRPATAATAPRASPQRPRDAGAASSVAHTPLSVSPRGAEVEALAAAHAALAERALALDAARAFYYDKLRDVELLVANDLRVGQMSASQLAEEVKRLLYEAPLS